MVDIRYLNLSTITTLASSNCTVTPVSHSFTQWSSFRPSLYFSIITSLLNLALKTLSCIFMVWFINFIPLQVQQLCTSPLFLKISTSTLILHSSNILSHAKIVLNNLIKMSTALSPRHPHTYTVMSSGPATFPLFILFIPAKIGPLNGFPLLLKSQNVWKVSRCRQVFWVIKTSSTAVFILKFNICLHVMTANSVNAQLKLHLFICYKKKKCNKKKMPGDIMSNFQGRRVKEVLHSGSGFQLLFLN